MTKSVMVFESFLAANLCPMYCLVCRFFVVWVGMTNSIPFVLEGGAECSKYFIPCKWGVVLCDVCRACY